MDPVPDNLETATIAVKNDADKYLNNPEFSTLTGRT